MLNLNKKELNVFMDPYQITLQVYIDRCTAKTIKLVTSYSIVYLFLVYYKHSASIYFTVGQFQDQRHISVAKKIEN